MTDNFVNKRIIVAKSAGFCFGVKRAIDMAVNGAAKGKIYSLGPLIHNETVVEDLEKRGVHVISSLEEAEEGSTVVIRSHGEPEKVYNLAAKKGIRLVDATCPFVEKIHNLVRETNKQVLIVGDENHPEVKGIAGWCSKDKPAIIINSAQGGFSEELFVVAQTTLRQEILDDVISKLEEEGVCFELHNTICKATKERQDECERLAKESDVMLVIGDRMSSNTRKLFDIAKKYCEHTYLIANKEDLPLHQLRKCNKIGTVAGASTPDYTIKEVIANMSENKELTMAELLLEVDIDKSLKLPRNGEIVTGKVHQVNEGEVIVNLGVKKDGILPKSEASLEEGQSLTDVFKVDDEIKAKVIKTDDGDGGILLSTKKLEYIANWEEIVKAYEDKSVLEVKVTRAVKGGVIAEYKEFSGFIPLSQLSDHFVVDAEEFIGKTMEVKVFRIDPSKTKAVFSHKLYLGEERQKLVKEVWDKLNVDDIVEGTVMRFTDYGAFVDIGGIDGLLHISEISWGKLKHPQEVLKIGDKINVKVLSMNEEKEKISLGLKQNTPEPWSVIDEKYQVGQIIEGKVVQIKEYGAFVELEPGLDGLVHISEVAHKRVENLSNELEVGQTVQVKILEVDKDRKRISLSIRETMDPPTAEEIAAEKAEAEAAKAEAAKVEAEKAEAAKVEEAKTEDAKVEEAPVPEEAPVAEIAVAEESSEEAAVEEPAEEA
ncbi:MAG: bifunctional 4-hydroxy-3-methylbut-2-enyl diphosphate reductase/30S ribosomal protein S1 [Eubacteriales bacterium]|nr:bifunctional 4-hydroxy-3-methylbut-2-enyl diphosphate reductase/30S ribosomal protein S1 [Eubacteriales bacterium]